MTTPEPLPEEAVTDAMLAAGWKHVTVGLTNGDSEHLKQLYRAMRAATQPAEAVRELWKGETYLDLQEARNPADDDFAKGFNGGLIAAREIIYKRLPALLATQPAALPEEEVMRRDELHSIIWEAGKCAEPLDGYPVPKAELAAFNYGKDCATTDIEEAVLRRLSAHLAPKPKVDEDAEAYARREISEACRDTGEDTRRY